MVSKQIELDAAPQSAIIMPCIWIERTSRAAGEEDSWGAFLTFVANSNKNKKHGFLQDFETIVLKIGGPSSPNDKQEVSRTVYYKFVEGKLEY